jgi:hypothetical protein
MCMFCGGESPGHSGALVAFGTMASFRAGLDRIQIRRAPPLPKPQQLERATRAGGSAESHEVGQPPDRG